MPEDPRPVLTPHDNALVDAIAERVAELLRPYLRQLPQRLGAADRIDQVGEARDLVEASRRWVDLQQRLYQERKAQGIDHDELLGDKQVANRMGYPTVAEFRAAAAKKLPVATHTVWPGTKGEPLYWRTDVERHIAEHGYGPNGGPMQYTGKKRAHSQAGPVKGRRKFPRRR